MYTWKTLFGKKQRALRLRPTDKTKYCKLKVTRSTHNPFLVATQSKDCFEPTARSTSSPCLNQPP